MVEKICTHCGYEGQAVKRPSDAADEPSEVKAAFDKLCRSIFLMTGIPVKPLAIGLVIPVYIVLLPLKFLFKEDGNKWCPNCGLPLMVSLKSDAGWLAKRKNDIKAGAIRIDQTEEERLAFGKEVVIPGDRAIEKAAPPPPKPEKLASLDEMLAPEPEPQPEPVAEPATEPQKPTKKPDPDAW